jgi:hypothetical protein
MKTFPTEAAAALASGEVIVAAGVMFGGAINAGFWGGYGELSFNNEAGQPETYTGLGDRAFAQAMGGTLGGAEQGVELTLSGIEPEVMSQLDLGLVRNCPVVIRQLIFNGSGARLLAAPVFLRGRVDSAPQEWTPAGTATLTLGVEGAARGLGRRSERMRSDADQRLIDPNDGFFARVAYAGEKQVVWGGKPPVRVGSAIGGVSPGRGGAGGSAGGADGGFDFARDSFIY